MGHLDQPMLSAKPKGKRPSVQINEKYIANFLPKPSKYGDKDTGK